MPNNLLSSDFTKKQLKALFDAANKGKLFVAARKMNIIIPKTPVPTFVWDSISEPNWKIKNKKKKVWRSLDDDWNVSKIFGN